MSTLSKTATGGQLFFFSDYRPIGSAVSQASVYSLFVIMDLKIATPSFQAVRKGESFDLQFC